MEAPAGHGEASPLSDDELLDRIRNRDSGAMRALFQRYYSRIYWFAQRRLHDSNLTEEVVADVFFEVWRSAASFAGASRPSTWIFGIAHFKCVGAHRDRKRHKRASVIPTNVEALHRFADGNDAGDRSIARGTENRDRAGTDPRAPVRGDCTATARAGRNREDACRASARAPAPGAATPRDRGRPDMTQERLVPTCPPEILEWIPWYADDALPETQRGAVEAHLAQCAECRLELAMLAGEAMPPGAPPDAEAAFAKVLARIEAAGVADPNPSSTNSIPVEAHRPLSMDRPAPARPSRRPARVRWMPRIAAAAALVAMAAFGWLARDLVAPGGEPRYQSASGPAATVAGGNVEQLDIVFRPDAAIERINANLRALGGVVISGPSQAGRYRIALPSGSDAAAAAELLRAEDTGVASFAEIVRP
jgi:RNA polymerase sigma factor (sigma-70 family)